MRKNKYDELNENSKKIDIRKEILITFALVLLIVCIIYAILNMISSNAPTTNESQSNSTNDLEQNDCYPFVCYEGICNVESEDLIPKANLINEHLRKVLTLISAANWDTGVYTLEDMDKYSLHSLIANNFLMKKII